MSTLVTRNISGKGIVRIDKNTEDFKKAKILSLFIDVIRRPVNEYLNLNYGVAKSRYGTILFLKDNYVVGEKSIDYPRERLDYYPELTYQGTYALQCAYAGILQSFFNFSAALSPITAVLPISINNGIKEWVHTDLFFDELRVVCYASTAIRFVIKSKPYDICEDEDNEEPDDPPPPPPPPDLLEPDEPSDDIDDPLEDDDFSERDPLDNPPSPPPPPPQVDCEPVDVVLETFNGSFFRTITYKARRPIGDITILRNGVAVGREVSIPGIATYQLSVQCKGIQLSATPPPCIGEGTYTVGIGTGNIPSLRVISP